jgi:hypothetical protein
MEKFPRNKRSSSPGASNFGSKPLDDPAPGENRSSRPLDQRVALFVSHKVKIHERAAHLIRDILESYSGRLDVIICEETPAGETWKKWIEGYISHSHVLLVLLPPGDEDLTWIKREIRLFKKHCEKGGLNHRLVVLKLPGSQVPGFLEEFQVVEASKEALREHFLSPLYRDPTFVCVEAPLNPRVPDLRLECDAEQIEIALRGVTKVRTDYNGERLVVHVNGCDPSGGLEHARVEAPNTCEEILATYKQDFSWDELVALADLEKGKGTFWIKEMEDVISEVARGGVPRVMTSTLRARGGRAGRIYRPQLESVELYDEKPVKYTFFFHEVLVPELVRGPDDIGVVFNLLHVATRVRWEVLNPILKKIRFQRSEMSPEDESELFGRVKRSLRIIDLEAERHGILDPGSVLPAFDDDDHELIHKMLDERKNLHIEIDAAIRRKDLNQFKGKLIKALDFNLRITKVLAKRFLTLVNNDNMSEAYPDSELA